ncbi:MAG: hypothetical protein HOL85_10455 [Rhodospirillaceae bacterium]|jgi:hypothetical protein|nr:hypothetical protein [Rhodospirillaceae bacterium]MBT6138520.1 hypothetical protein [Rhodospirillaceae bacterium]
MADISDAAVVPDQSLTVRQRAMTILADSVSAVVGPRNLAYVAIRKASMDADQSKDQWASMMFNQLPVSNRKQIRTSAIDKAHEEKTKQTEIASAVVEIIDPRSGKVVDSRPDNSAQSLSNPEAGKAVEARLSDFRKLFGGSRR